MLNIALPTGRMGEDAYRRFAAVGCECEGVGTDRRLIYQREGLRYLMVKPSDVAMYVEHGAADIGVVGRDVLMEDGPDVFELLDLGFGRCRFAVAAPLGWTDSGGPIRVATKYRRVAGDYFLSQGRQAELIKLHGSVELAPLVGLSDVIVDIVETGSTLRQNGLEVIADIAPSSARLIANKSSYQFRASEIGGIKRRLEAAL